MTQMTYTTGSITSHLDSATITSWPFHKFPEGPTTPYAGLTLPVGQARNVFALGLHMAWSRWAPSTQATCVSHPRQWQCHPENAETKTLWWLWLTLFLIAHASVIVLLFCLPENLTCATESSPVLCWHAVGHACCPWPQRLHPFYPLSPEIYPPHTFPHLMMYVILRAHRDRLLPRIHSMGVPEAPVPWAGLAAGWIQQLLQQLTGMQNMFDGWGPTSMSQVRKVALGVGYYPEVKDYWVFQEQEPDSKSWRLC